LPNDDAVESSDAVKLTAEILRKQACGIGERTNEMGIEMSDMTETEREGDTIEYGWEAGPLHEPKKEIVAPKRLSEKRKRRVQTRSVQREAQHQRKRR
jgi:hypothetical protein